MQVRRLIRAVAASFAASLIAVGAAGTAQAEPATYFQQVAENLKASPVYVDPKASPLVTPDQARALSDQLKAASQPVFLVLVENGQLSSTSVDQALSEIAGALARPAIIGLSSDKGFFANGFRLPSSVATQAGAFAKQAVDLNREKNGKPIPFEVYTQWASNVGKLTISAAQVPPAQNGGVTLQTGSAATEESSNAWWVVLLVFGSIVLIAFAVFALVKQKQRRRERREAKLAKERLEREIAQINFDLVAMVSNLGTRAYNTHASALTNAQSAQSMFDAGALESAQSFLGEAQRQYKLAQELNQDDTRATSSMFAPHENPTDVPDNPDNEKEIRMDRHGKDQEPAGSKAAKPITVRRPGGGTMKFSPTPRPQRETGYDYNYSGGFYGGTYFPAGFYAVPFWDYEVVNDGHGDSPSDGPRDEHGTSGGAEGAVWNDDPPANAGGSNWEPAVEAPSTRDDSSTSNSGSSWSDSNPATSSGSSWGGAPEPSSYNPSDSSGGYGGDSGGGGYSDSGGSGW